MNPQFEKRGMIGFRFFLVLGFILFLIMLTAYFFYGLEPVLFKEEANESAVAVEREFKINKGESFKEISARLSQSGFIKSISVFKSYSLITGRAQKFQPGIYKLSPTMSVPEIVSILTAGGQNEIKITIPEGYTIKDIERALITAGLPIEKNSLVNYSPRQLTTRYPYLSSVNSLEGFLFPDTYRFYIDAKSDEVLRIFVDNFDKKVWPLLQSYSDWYEKLILASFLEGEVPDFEDRQLVAGILLKRLKIKMPLQVDATLVYVKCGGDIKICTDVVLNAGDFNLSSPYNTYKNLGLTPTPINNPGESAVKAALSPKESRYLYYLSSPKIKETIFSKTLEEHNRNKVKHL